MAWRDREAWPSAKAFPFASGGYPASSAPFREERGLSCKEVATALDCSESKISRMETGERGLYADDVAAILGFLRAPGKLRQELLDLVRNGEARNWHEIHGKLPTNWKDLIQLEGEASALYDFEPF